MDTNSEERPADDFRVFWEMAEKKEIEVMKQKRWKNDDRSNATKSSVESNVCEVFVFRLVVQLICNCIVVIYMFEKVNLHQAR